MSIINVHSSVKLGRKLGNFSAGGQILAAVYCGKSGNSLAGAFCRSGF